MITPILNPKIPQVRAQVGAPSRKSLTFRPQLSADVVSFGNKVQDNFMSQSDDKIFSAVKQALASCDILGTGGEAEVYKIADSGYCVRHIYYKRNDQDRTLKRSDFTRKVSEQDKVNHVVAKIGENVTVMPIIPGHPVRLFSMFEKEVCRIATEIEDLPQSAFHKLLRQISDAYDKDMMWDCNWANLLVDTKGKTLTAIDFYKNSFDESASHLGYIFAALTHDYTTEQQCKVYAEKIMNAGLEEFKPGVTPCCHFDNFGFPDFIRAMDDLELFTNKKYTKLLRELTYRIRDLKFQEIRGENVANELSGQIKVIKSIMRQLVKY